MLVTRGDIVSAIRALGLAGRAVCVHSSLRSFGQVEGGAATFVESFLQEGCTLVVPTFSSVFEVTPPPRLRFARNGWNYDGEQESKPGERLVYTPETPEIDREMGAIPASIVALPESVRGRHPLDSFAAVGSRAAALISLQAPLDVYAPLVALARVGGSVLLAGVGLERMTLLHLAEREAGRRLFRRWANGADSLPSAVEVGGCSEGFGKLESSLSSLARTVTVGRSVWKLFPAAQTLERTAAAIRANPRLTHCDDETCERCDDAEAGGPIL